MRLNITVIRTVDSGMNIRVIRTEYRRLDIRQSLELRAGE